MSSNQLKGYFGYPKITWGTPWVGYHLVHKLLILWNLLCSSWHNKCCTQFPFPKKSCTLWRTSRSTKAKLNCHKTKPYCPLRKSLPSPPPPPPLSSLPAWPLRLHGCPLWHHSLPKEISHTNLETFEEEEEEIIIIIITNIISSHHQQTKYSSRLLNKVDWLITDRLPTTEHLFISSSYVLHFEWFQNVLGVLPQALEIIFEVQRKRSNF